MPCKRGGTNRVELGLKVKGRTPIEKTRQAHCREMTKQGKSNKADGDWTSGKCAPDSIHYMVISGYRFTE